jgi:hypothetical protein
MFSFRTHGFCPSCYAKRLDEWGEWIPAGRSLTLPAVHDISWKSEGGAESHENETGEPEDGDLSFSK